MQFLAACNSRHYVKIAALRNSPHFLQFTALRAILKSVVLSDPAALRCSCLNSRNELESHMIVSGDAFAAVGQLLLSIIFLLGGFQKIAAVSGTVAYMSSLGVPFPALVTVIAIVVEILGGILTLVGYKARLTGLIMGLWCIPLLWRIGTFSRWST
jgi:uncharacterized membrane protein YphA (DoxX/SURF4 family)